LRLTDGIGAAAGFFPKRGDPCPGRDAGSGDDLADCEGAAYGCGSRLRGSSDGSRHRSDVAGDGGYGVVALTAQDTVSRQVVDLQCKPRRGVAGSRRGRRVVDSGEPIVDAEGYGSRTVVAAGNGGIGWQDRMRHEAGTGDRLRRTDGIGGSRVAMDPGPQV